MIAETIILIMIIELILLLKIFRKIYISNGYYKKIKRFIQTILFIKFVSKYIIVFNRVSKI